MIDCIIKALGLDVGTVDGKVTPAEAKPLVNDTDGEVAHSDFSYSSVLGIMLFLSGHSTLDIAFAVNCAACCIFCPRHSHDLALKRIGRYLKAAHSRVLILNPSSNLKIDCYSDADFTGMYGNKKTNDPTCVKSRTSCVITVADCPALWQSSCQSETILPNMEAGVISLAHSCKEFLLIMDMV